MSITEDVLKLTDQQRREFSVDCFDRVYPLISHYDRTGELQKAVAVARTDDQPSLDAAGLVCRRFVKSLVKNDLPANAIAAAKAGRECFLGNAQVVASLTAQIAVDSEAEVEWQTERLRQILS